MCDPAPVIGARQLHTWHGPVPSPAGRWDSTVDNELSSGRVPAATAVQMGNQEVMSTRQARPEITVRIENISPPGTLIFSDDSGQAADDRGPAGHGTRRQLSPQGSV
ncbi:MAG: hypothetical protein QF670_02415 [Alphaproteobacteria bacterium]|jgi:hypothetical protein|nr:hypothetical protein [Alphaproteobacteria bacterium]HJN20649.1 hypothetical protein [Alphaproteobacteria bacterium]|tara:strand:+ start:1399 stop:1719 length:321 start_codon:yes stop_codon:yes gene_type:complete